MSGFYAMLILAGLGGIGVGFLFLEWVARMFERWHERRCRHIQNAELNRFNMGAFKAVSRDWRNS